MKFLDDISLSQLELALDGLQCGDLCLEVKLQPYSCKLAGKDRKFSKSLEQRLSNSANNREKYSRYSSSAGVIKPASYNRSHQKWNSPFVRDALQSTLAAKEVTNNHNNATISNSNNLASSLHLSEIDASDHCSSSGELLATSLTSSSVTAARKLFASLVCTLNAAFYPDYDFSRIATSQISSITNSSQVVEEINTRLDVAFHHLHPNFKDDLWRAIDSEIKLDESETYTYEPDFESDPFSGNGTLWSFNYFFYNRSLKKILFFACCAKTAAFEPLDEDEHDILSPRLKNSSDKIWDIPQFDIEY